MSSVYIVGGDYAIERMFEARGWVVVDKLEDADVVQFTGGADVSPHLYGEAPHHTTRSLPARDKREIALFEYAVEHDVPCLGICRGGQFLNVMNGGKLWQNVNGHAIRGTHVAYVLDEGGNVIDEVQVTSTHHQMMRPTEEAVILATAHEATWLESDTIKTKAGVGYGAHDIEAVYYEKSKSLCFQPHPEYGVQSCTELYFQLIERTLGL